ncbi:MAG: orotate phosphoribosyltransferase [Anaerolineae bacterium]|nr:orotate phosphoribosyltransferase [Thermoflexales bacterium]MDW8408600.1 orotate phosphoribosyltransferase [Anaerolineae bacterium]
MNNSAFQLATALFDIGCVQFGQFKLKSGLISPIYIDLRLLVSWPAVLSQVARAMAARIDDRRITFDRLAAIPYAGLPIGVAVALETGRPLIYPRKEAKEYGTARLIEGEYKAGETVLLVDDLITKGTSKFEALAPLLDAGLVVREVLVLIDREQGGASELAARGVTLHAVLSLSDLLGALVQAGRLSASRRDEVLAWLRAN